MGVSPPQEIVVADVHSSGVSDFPVNHDNLSVVAVVELGEKVDERPARFREFDDFNAGLHHFIIIRRQDGDIGDVLVYESDLDPFPSLLHQHFLDYLASLVLAEIEILHMDMLLGIPQVFHKKFELPPSGRDYFQFVSVCDTGGAVAGQQISQGSVILLDLFVVLVPEQQLMDFLSRV